MIENLNDTKLPGNVTKIDLAAGKTIYLLGTAHVSRESVEEVKETIKSLKPDTVCVELDEERLQALRNPKMWEKLNLGAALRQGKGPFLMANLVLSAFQRKLGLQTGVKPGEELFEAVNTGENEGAKVVLVDRNIRTTLLRAWRSTGFFRKLMLMATMLASAFETEEIDEDTLADLKSRDTLSAVMDELGKELPSIKTILIDERDEYMASGILSAPGSSVVAVVGAGHVPGLTKIISGDQPSKDVTALDVIPPKSLISKAIPWLIPAVVVGLFIAGFFFADPAKIKDAALAWVLANGILSSAGALLALGHPLTVISAFIAAPITSLNPTIGAGMVTGVVQAWAGKPSVKDIEDMWEDLSHWKGWWRNRVSRVLLVFLFSSWGSAIGTFVAFKWLKDLI